MEFSPREIKNKCDLEPVSKLKLKMIAKYSFTYLSNLVQSNEVVDCRKELQKVKIRLR